MNALFILFRIKGRFTQNKNEPKEEKWNNAWHSGWLQWIDYLVALCVKTSTNWINNKHIVLPTIAPMRISFHIRVVLMWWHHLMVSKVQSLNWAFKWFWEQSNIFQVLKNWWNLSAKFSAVHQSNPAVWISV